MRDEAEKKTRSTTLRMTENQYALIERKAKEKGMSVGSYIVNKAVHGENLSPELVVRMQDVMNIAYRIIQDNEPETAKYLRGEMTAIWSNLK